MKLESLKSQKFNGKALKRGQMDSLKGGDGGGDPTGGGTNVEVFSGGQWFIVDYTYDSVRSNGVETYHGRYNYRAIQR